MSEHFFVSVIIPVYNGEAFIHDVMSTVRNQNYEPFEVIIIDDGSTDQTASIIKGYKECVRYYYQGNQGSSAARNLGIKMAHGDVLAFLDVDDLWPPDKLAVQVACLEAQPRLEIVSGYVQFMNRVSGDGKSMLFEEICSPHFIMSLGGTIIKKSVFNRIGYFDEKLFLAEDVNWLLRAFEKGVPTGVLKKVTLYYRRHPHGISFGQDLRSCRFITEIKKSLDRRRDCCGSVVPIPSLQYYELPLNIDTR